MPARNERGFSLIELMVALVVAGILVGVIFQFLVGQGRVARYQTAREEVQQNARVALELISSDLRAVGPSGIINRGANSITFRAPKAWGIVCGRPTAGGPLAVAFPRAVAPVLSSSTRLFVRDTVWTVSEASATSAEVTFCNDSLQPAPRLAASDGRLRMYTLPAGAPNYPRRAHAYVYDNVTYDVAETTVQGKPGIWVRRTVGGNTQPLAGPLPSNGGLSFTYADETGAPTTDRDRIRRIKIIVTASSLAKFKNEAQVDTDSTIIYLRNRPLTS